MYKPRCAQTNPRRLAQYLTSLRSMHVCSQARVCMCCSSVRATLLELRRHRAFVFYLGLCMFSCNITGTWSKSNGPIAKLEVTSLSAATTAGIYLISRIFVRAHT